MICWNICYTSIPVFSCRLKFEQKWHLVWQSCSSSQLHLHHFSWSWTLLSGTYSHRKPNSYIIILRLQLWFWNPVLRHLLLVRRQLNFLKVEHTEIPKEKCALCSPITRSFFPSLAFHPAPLSPFSLPHPQNMRSWYLQQNSSHPMGAHVRHWSEHVFLYTPTPQVSCNLPESTSTSTRSVQRKQQWDAHGSYSSLSELITTFKTKLTSLRASRYYTEGCLGTVYL